MRDYLDCPSLCEVYKDYFKVGAALNYLAYSNKTIESEIAKKNFNIVVAENDTKMENIYTGENRYDFSYADKFLAFASDNHMDARWHTLLWHKQCSQWIFSDENGNPASPELIEKRIKTYFQKVISHCKGKVTSYDVIESPISNKTGTLRKNDENSRWAELLGENYLEKIFNWAHDLDSSAELVINDYNIESDEKKRNGLYLIVSGLLKKGVPVSGVGLQMHTSIQGAPIQEIEDTINLFGNLGLKVLITEMDVSVYKYKEPELKNFNSIIIEQQAKRYKELFECFKRCAKKGFIEKVLLWGVTDEFSWRNTFPVQNRTDIPLLFKMDGSVKPAFDSLVL